MVDWSSPLEIQKDAAAFGKLMHCLLGLYIWEWFTSLNFDWQYISGNKKFRWPLIFYFLNRYCLLFALIGIAISLNVTTRVDCQSLYTFNALTGNAAIGLASINLSLRTMAVWHQSWFVVVPLVLVIMGHWSLLLHGVLVKAEWDDAAGCLITGTDSKLLAATFIYSMAFDFVVLVLTAYKLFFGNASRSRLVSLIFNDGLIYFAIAFIANLTATVFMLLNLNPIMSIICNVPAAIASSIVACRAVRRLNKFTSAGPEVYASTTQGSTLAFRSNMMGSRGKGVTSKVATNTGSEGVHVQMETLQISTANRNSGYDESGNMKGDMYDPEAQHIHDEFKSPPY
ncbi:hypothetical protein BDN72DRAFT_875763 [Pluteus cervinus]|uniref:Uncharacterized protein n=1 Tax=Pluteus cervinus TaxID=181527 RepID=A0ACD3B6X1_9AGAR|nr:hypothetical protein BDN72DRAFT_875763 [Pluteus cervinus]